MARVRLAVLCLFCATLVQGVRAEEVSARDFTMEHIAQPGGLDTYVRWESSSRTLTYKTIVVAVPPIDVRKLTAADSRKVDEIVALGLDHMAALITALPDQKTLPDDRVVVFDGGRYELSCVENGQAITRLYKNPDAHDRLMDIACLGLVDRVQALAQEAFAKAP